MPYHCVWLCLLACVLLGCQAVAEVTTRRTHDIEIDDLFTIVTVSGIQTSPAGRQTLYTHRQWDLEQKKRVSTLRLIDHATGETRRVVPDAVHARSPRWGRQSQSIYYLHKSDGEGGGAMTQVWRVPADGGEPRRVTRVEGGIERFSLADDPSRGTLVYFTQEQQSGATISTRVHRFETESNESALLYEVDGVVREMAVSPNGRYVALVTSPDHTLLKNEGWSELIVYDTAANKPRLITPEGWRANHPSPYGWLDTLRWADDSKALAFTTGFDGFPPIIYTAEFDGSSAEVHAIKRPAEIFPKASTLAWRPGSRDLLFLAQKTGHQHLYRFTNLRDGGYERLDLLTPGDVVISDVTIAGPDRLVLDKATTTQPQDLYLMDLDGNEQKLTDLNPQIDTWKLPSIRLVEWDNGSGRTIEGVLELPPDHEPGKPLPMVVYLHGGPTSSNLERLRFFRGRVLLAAKGYAVFCPNFRGSTGYGDDFIHELIGHNNQREVQDVISGIEAMIERGIADPDRIGVMGWSYGGYLTNCMITRGELFKAAISGAGIVDMNLQWGLMDTPGWVMNFMAGAKPWEDPALYQKSSPIQQMHKATAATLIHVGGEDPRCPPANAHVLYRALKQFGNADAQLLIYPGEGHHLSRYQHIRARAAWNLAWFDKYLRGSEAALPSAEGLTP